MNKYLVKNQNNKQNKNVFGMTDYECLWYDGL